MAQNRVDGQRPHIHALGYTGLIHLALLPKDGYTHTVTLTKVHPVRLLILLVAVISMLLPSGFVVNCVGADGHQGNEIMGVTHCDDSDTDSTTHPSRSSESALALASSNDLGCTDTPLMSEVFSRTDQHQSQTPAFSPAPLLFVVDNSNARLDNKPISVLQDEPGTCRPHPSAIRCVILIV